MISIVKTHVSWVWLFHWTNKEYFTLNYFTTKATVIGHLNFRAPEVSVDAIDFSVDSSEGKKT